MGPGWEDYTSVSFIEWAAAGAFILLCVVVGTVYWLKKGAKGYKPQLAVFNVFIFGLYGWQMFVHFYWR